MVIVLARRHNLSTMCCLPVSNECIVAKPYVVGGR